MKGEVIVGISGYKKKRTAKGTPILEEFGSELDRTGLDTDPTIKGMQTFVAPIEQFKDRLGQQKFYDEQGNPLLKDIQSGKKRTWNEFLK